MGQQKEGTMYELNGWMFTLWSECDEKVSLVQCVRPVEVKMGSKIIRSDKTLRNQNRTNVRTEFKHHTAPCYSLKSIQSVLSNQKNKQANLHDIR